MTHVTPALMSVARGDEPADLLLTNARVVNVFTQRIDEEMTVAFHRDRIAAVAPMRDRAGASGRQVVDLAGACIGPGFIDAHMHVESTMMLPTEFARLAVPRGTTGVVLDPHEIANVLGIEGIRYLMDNAEGLPLNVMWAVPSCVPSSPLETAAVALSADDLAPLFDDDRVVALAELMNFPGVFLGVPEVLDKVNLGLEHRIVDGHCPGLRGAPLQAYAAAGISSDHECTSLAEAREKLALGMRIYVREGSAARNLEALLPIITPTTAHRISFCTDDRHPADLKNEGHIDHIIRKAIDLGLDPALAITIASFHTAQHYGRRDLGAVAPGYKADCIVFDDPQRIEPSRVYFHGQLVAEAGCYTLERKKSRPSPRAPVSLPPLNDDSLRIECSDPARSIRVIGMKPDQLVTEMLTLEPTIVDGAHVADPARDILKMVVIERHGGSGTIGRGFVHGFGLEHGALASTVSHDSHNLVVVGVRDEDMLAAARALADVGGGQCVVRDGTVLAVLPLPVAGLMSDQPAETVIEQQQVLLAAATTLGCPLHDPFMSLSFMPLTVIPKLKLSDLGLVDVEKFQIVPLEI